MMNPAKSGIVGTCWALPASVRITPTLQFFWGAHVGDWSTGRGVREGRDQASPLTTIFDACQFSRRLAAALRPPVPVAAAPPPTSSCQFQLLLFVA
jgi:hypothetical protein